MKNTSGKLSSIGVEDVTNKLTESCQWANYKRGDQISLGAVLEIIELPPRWKTHLEDSDADVFNKIGLLEEFRHRFKESILTSLKHTSISNILLDRTNSLIKVAKKRAGIREKETSAPNIYHIFFYKWELINWMEKEAEADFMYMLPQDFVEFCRKKQAMPSYSELLEENRELKQKNETLEKEIKKLQKQDVGVRDRSKIKIFIVKLASQIKKDMAKNHIAIDGVIVQAILMFLDLEADAYGTVIDSDGKEVKGLSVSFLRKALIEENLMSTNNKVGKKSKEMREKEEAILQMIADSFEKAQYRKLYRESEEIQKMLKYKK